MKSDLNVGWPMPIVDGACWSRFVGSSGGLLIRIATGGGGRNPGGADGGNDVAGASGGSGWWADSGGREKVAEGVESDLLAV